MEAGVGRKRGRWGEGVRGRSAKICGICGKTGRMEAGVGRKK
jgi:hypothetical protein